MNSDATLGRLAECFGLELSGDPDAPAVLAATRRAR